MSTWQAGTLATYDAALDRILPRIGDLPPDSITPESVAALVAELHRDGRKKQSIRKTVSVLAMVLDHARMQPNPARDKLTVKMPREEKRHVQPPTGEHVEAVVSLLPTPYRLPTLLLDATGMRVGELEALTWGDVDEPRETLADRHKQNRTAAVGVTLAGHVPARNRARPPRRSAS